MFLESSFSLQGKPPQIIRERNFNPDFYDVTVKRLLFGTNQHSSTCHVFSRASLNNFGYVTTTRKNISLHDIND